MVVLRRRSRAPSSSRLVASRRCRRDAGASSLGFFPFKVLLGGRPPWPTAHRSPHHPKVEDDTELRSAPDSRRNAGGGPAHRLAGGSAVMQHPTGLHLEGSHTARGRWRALRRRWPKPSERRLGSVPRKRGGSDPDGIPSAVLSHGRANPGPSGRSHRWKRFPRVAPRRCRCR
jgi:hypothetical protein